jgi:hypothetical protein
VARPVGEEKKMEVERKGTNKKERKYLWTVYRGDILNVAILLNFLRLVVVQLVFKEFLYRLQEAKQRTREEFTRNINQILEGTSFDKKVKCFQPLDIKRN